MFVPTLLISVGVSDSVRMAVMRNTLNGCLTTDKAETIKVMTKASLDTASKRFSGEKQLSMTV